MFDESEITRPPKVIRTEQQPLDVKRRKSAPKSVPAKRKSEIETTPKHTKKTKTTKVAVKAAEDSESDAEVANPASTTPAKASGQGPASPKNAQFLNLRISGRHYVKALGPFVVEVIGCDDDAKLRLGLTADPEGERPEHDSLWLFEESAIKVWIGWPDGDPKPAKFFQGGDGAAECPANTYMAFMKIWKFQERGDLQTANKVNQYHLLLHMTLVEYKLRQPLSIAGDPKAIPDKLKKFKEWLKELKDEKLPKSQSSQTPVKPKRGAKRSETGNGEGEIAAGKEKAQDGEGQKAAEVVLRPKKDLMTADYYDLLVTYRQKSDPHLTNWKMIVKVIDFFYGLSPPVDMLRLAKSWVNLMGETTDPFTAPIIGQWRLRSSGFLTRDWLKPLPREETKLIEERKMFSTLAEKPIGRFLAPLSADDPRKETTHIHMFGVVIPLRPGGKLQKVAEGLNNAQWAPCRDAPKKILPKYL